VAAYGLVLALGAAAAAQPVCVDGVQSSGALYRVCVPPAAEWNGHLVLFAHGYVDEFQPLTIPDQEVGDGVMLSELVTGLGYAFATTSYSTNGLAILAGLEDIRDLVDVFADSYGPPGHVFLVGGSEGGIVTALAVEQYPEVFDGGLAACGPIGSFRAQINYVGDFRAVFQVLYPNLLPEDGLGIPQEVIDNWETVYRPAIVAAIWADIPRLIELLRITRVPVDVYDPANLAASIENTIVKVLWYNVFTTNDAIAKLGGNPFDNATRVYSGSSNDALLNALAPRFAADPAALAAMQAYETSGVFGVPLVTLHTFGDEIIRYWHEFLYLVKVWAGGSNGRYTHLPVARYGHCEFELQELLVAFAWMVYQATGTLPALHSELVPGSTPIGHLLTTPPAAAPVAPALSPLELRRLRAAVRDIYGAPGDMAASRARGVQAAP
jgi:pimeloyl-ACP methyl ester carboxylesterase